jgi:hypothetical protein
MEKNRERPADITARINELPVFSTPFQREFIGDSEL